MQKTGKDGRNGGEILFEFRQVGRLMRVAAVCAKSNLEVTVVAPLDASRADLVRLAERKLDYIRAKRGVA